MKNKIKKIFLYLSIVALFITSLQLPCIAEKQHFDNDIVTAMKQPVSKKQIAYKFIMAMFGVVASSIVIYVGLTAYNKFFLNCKVSVKKNQIKLNSDIKRSIISFLNKTDWD